MSDSKDFLLKIQGASFSYPQSSKKALDNVSLELKQGEYVALLGANGSGKSTLARLMAGFFDPDNGEVQMDENVLPGIVFQQPKEQIVAGVVERDTAFGPQNMDMDKSEIELRTMECLSVVGLADRADSRTFELSLGQTQRLAFSGILALFPDLLILDEVTAMLDPNSRTEILQLIQRWHNQNHTVIHVTHDQDEALMADRIVVMDKGKKIFDGNRDDFITDSNLCASIFGQQIFDSYIEEKQLDELETTLKVENLSFRYPERTVFENLSFELKKGTLTALTGPSGCGKSTLFECLSGLRESNNGKIFAKERPVLALQESEASLFATYAADDVAFGPKNRGVDGKELLTRVKKSMEMAGLDYKEFRDRGTFKLSGGEKRKLSLAGIIALDSEIMIFDEPTSALDPISRTMVLKTLRQLADEGKTVLFSTHRMEEASFADCQLSWENLVEQNLVEQKENLSEQKKSHENSSETKQPKNQSLKEFKMMENAKMLKTLSKVSSALMAPPSIPDSPISRLPSALKFGLFLLIFTATLVSGNSIFSVAMIGVSIIYALLAKYDLRKPLYAYLRLLPFFLIFSILQLVLFSSSADTSKLLWEIGWVKVTQSKLDMALRTLLRAPAMVISLGCFIYTTSEREIMDGLTVILTPFALIKIPVRYFVLVIGIMFRFIPLLLDELSGIIKTHLVRGAFGKAKGLGKIKIIVPLFVPLILQTFRKAQYLADALTARYFS